jgi:1-acyl-sn-glycerol-3-phosphate acyltransferase
MKRGLFLALARRYVRFRLKRTFARTRLFGEDELLDHLGKEPLIVALNHVTFWDPLVLVMLDERWGGAGRALMDAENLKKLPFFAKVGAIPVDRTKNVRAFRDLEAAGRGLTQPGQFLVIFPQGEERPAHLPMQFREGLRFLAKRTGCAVVPGALRYDFGKAERPYLHISFGAPIRYSGGEDFLALVAASVEVEVRRVDAELLWLNGTADAAQGTSFRDVFPFAEESLPRGTGLLGKFSKGKDG